MTYQSSIQTLDREQMQQVGAGGDAGAAVGATIGAFIANRVDAVAGWELGSAVGGALCAGFGPEAAASCAAVGGWIGANAFGTVTGQAAITNAGAYIGSYIQDHFTSWFKNTSVDANVNTYENDMYTNANWSDIYDSEDNIEMGQSNDGGEDLTDGHWYDSSDVGAGDYYSFTSGENSFVSGDPYYGQYGYADQYLYAS